MAGAWCAACCSPSVLPAVFPVSTCKRALRLSSSSAHSNSGLRRQSCRGGAAVQSSSCRSEVQYCCSFTFGAEPDCSDSGRLDSHLATRRQLLLLTSGAAAAAAALPSYADEVLSLLPLFS